MYCINCSEPLIFEDGLLVHEDTLDQACDNMDTCKTCGYVLEYSFGAWRHTYTPTDTGYADPAPVCDCPTPVCGDLAQIGWPFSGDSDTRNMYKVVGDDVYILRHCAPGYTPDSVWGIAGLMGAPQSRFEAGKIRLPFDIRDDVDRAAARIAVNLWNTFADYMATPAGHVLNALHDMGFGAVALYKTGGVWRVMDDGDVPARPGYIVVSAKGDDTAVHAAQLKAAQFNEYLWTVTKLPHNGAPGESVTGVAFDDIEDDGYSTPTDAELTALFAN